MNNDAVEAIARATLYEGHVLWPYRQPAGESRPRWSFGGLYPPGFRDLESEAEAREMRCETLLEGDAGTHLFVEIRFLQVVHRQVLAGNASDGRAGLRPVPRLAKGPGANHVTGDEAMERRVPICATDLRSLFDESWERSLAIPADGVLEAVRDGSGEIVGELHRTWESISVRVRLGVERLGDRLFRVLVTAENRSDWRGTDREAAQRRSPMSPHFVLRARGGEFCSLDDPPSRFADAAEECRNVGVWPALVGEDGSRDTVLASPVRSLPA